MKFLKRLFRRCATPCNSNCATASAPSPPSIDNAAILQAKLLDPDYEFRSLSTLEKAVPTLSRYEVLATLNSIGARSAYRNTNLWGLKSRVGDRARSRYDC